MGTVWQWLMRRLGMMACDSCGTQTRLDELLSRGRLGYVCAVCVDVVDPAERLPCGNCSTKYPIYSLEMFNGPHGYGLVCPYCYEMLQIAWSPDE